MRAMHRFNFHREEKSARQIIITSTDENIATIMMKKMFENGYALYDSKWNYDKKEREMIFEKEARQID